MHSFPLIKLESHSVIFSLFLLLYHVLVFLSPPSLLFSLFLRLSLSHTHTHVRSQPDTFDKNTLLRLNKEIRSILHLHDDGTCRFCH